MQVPPHWRGRHTTNELTKLFSDETVMRVTLLLLKVSRTKRHEYFANFNRSNF